VKENDEEGRREGVTRKKRAAESDITPPKVSHLLLPHHFSLGMQKRRE